MPGCILDLGDEARTLDPTLPTYDWVCVIPPFGSDPSNVSLFFDAVTRQILASQYAARFNKMQGFHL